MNPYLAIISFSPIWPNHMEIWPFLCWQTWKTWKFEQKRCIIYFYKLARQSQAILWKISSVERLAQPKQQRVSCRIFHVWSTFGFLMWSRQLRSKRTRVRRWAWRVQTPVSVSKSKKKSGIPKPGFLSSGALVTVISMHIAPVSDFLSTSNSVSFSMSQVSHSVVPWSEP